MKIKNNIRELEEVCIKRDYEKFNLKKGQRGIIVMIHDNRNVEFGCCIENKLVLLKLPAEAIQ